MSEPSPNDEFLTKRELARLCRCSERTIDRLLEVGEFSLPNTRGNGFQTELLSAKTQRGKSRNDRCPPNKQRPRPLERPWGRGAMSRLRIELALSLNHPRNRRKLPCFGPS